MNLICEMGDCLRQAQLTIHLAVHYMDRYFYIKASNCSSDRTDDFIDQKLISDWSSEVLAATFLILASKFDEIDDNIPMIEDVCKTYKVVSNSLDLRFDN